MFLSPKQPALWLMGAALLAGCSISMSTVMPPATATMELPAATQSPTATSLPTQAGTATSTSIAMISVQTGTDRATFIKEAYPDYASVAPGKKFVKTWDIKNIGSNTWNTNYKLIVDATPQNDSLGSPAEVNFGQDVSPGETVTLSIPLVAPMVSGTYSVYWKLQNDRGKTFGVDGDRVWVTIMVCEAGKTCSPPSASSSSSASGISMTLTNFTHDARSATVDFCMTVPNRYYALGSPVPALLIDQKPAPFLEGGSTQPWGCYFMKYQISAAQLEQAQHIVLSIDTALRMSPPPGDPNVACQSAKADLISQYPGLDFQCHFSTAGYYINLQLPTGMTRDQAQQIIMDAVEGAIYGPWNLTIR